MGLKLISTQAVVEDEVGVELGNIAQSNSNIISISGDLEYRAGPDS